MFDQLDQIFVTLKHLVMGHVSAAWVPLASAMISIALIPMVFPGLFAVITVIERKRLGRIVVDRTFDVFDQRQYVAHAEYA